MNALTEFIKRQPLCKSFTITAELVGMKLDAFHAFAQYLASEGGGDGFDVLNMHSESQSGFRYIDTVNCMRVPMFDGS